MKLDGHGDLMGMTPVQFFEAFVRGNYEDFLQNPGCVRRAFNAAVSTYHLADHYWAYYRRHDRSRVKAFKTKEAYLQFLEKGTGNSFRDIQSIANAYKHLYTSAGRKKTVDASISSTGAIESISLPNENAEAKGFEQAYVGGTGGSGWELRVIFTRKNGQKIESLPTLRKVIEHFESLLK